MNKPQKQIGAAAQPRKTTLQALSQGCRVSWRGIGDSVFDIPVAILFRVEFWCILGQGLDQDFRMIPQIAEGRLASMNPRVITNQDKPLRHEAPEMLQDGDHILTIHRPFKMAFVNLARKRQANGGRQHPAVTCDATNDWSLPARSPSPPKPVQKGRAQLIKKHDVYAAPPRFF